MIPFIDLQAQQSRIRIQIDAAIQKVLDHRQFIMGPEVRELESKLCEYVGVQHCISVSNGTDALSAALMALNVGVGDAVITTPFTFFATIESIMLRGATPVFADIEPNTFNICPYQIKQAIDRAIKSDLRVRGIIPVDLYGLPADYEKINAIARKYDLFVLQDAAQSFGAIRDGKRAPSHTPIGITSFFPAKPLGCYGDGGAVFTNDDELADRVRSIRMHGKGVDKYDNIRVGLNARLDTIQAAVLLEKLKIYGDEFERRQQVARVYHEAVDNLMQMHPDFEIGFQTITRSCQSAWAQFVIRSPFRDQIAEYLKAKGIPTLVYYRTPAHQLRACRNLPMLQSMPNSEKVSGEVLALPFHPYLQPELIHRIRDEMANWFEESTISGSKP